MRIKMIVRCSREKCFNNKDKVCQLLEKPIEGKACPFYKSIGRVETEEFALAVGQMRIYREAARIDREEL